jgi:hypothetical protein
MAKFEQRDNSGALFKNDKKEKPNHPDYQGTCMVNGVPMRMSAWLKDGQNGKFMSFAFSEPYSRDGGNESTAAHPSVEDMESDIPF